MCAKRIVNDVPNYFYRPSSGRSQNWYVRLIPPPELKGIPGVREFRRSTKTSSLRQAKVVGSKLIAMQLAEWNLLLKKEDSSSPSTSTLTPELIEHICARRLYHWLNIDDEGRLIVAGYTEETRKKLNEFCLLTQESIQAALIQGKAASSWPSFLDSLEVWCMQSGYPSFAKDPLYHHLLRAFAQVELDGANKLLRRNAGEIIQTPPKPKNSTPPATLSCMTDVYKAYKQQYVSSKHLSASLSVWKRLLQHLGDVPLNSVSQTNLYDFLDFGMQSGELHWSMRHAHGKVKRTLSEFFALARTKGLLNGPNPVDALEILPLLNSKEELSRRKPRYPFSDSQINLIFDSDWYKPDSTNWRGKMRKDLGARYWVPLFCLFHGCRVREVLQLLTSDISKNDGISVIHFNEVLDTGETAISKSGASRSIKNESTNRIIPIHPKLIELGILDFIKERENEDGKHAMLFPSSLPESGGKSPILGRSYEQSFLRHVRDSLAFGNGYGSHSFRHQLEDRIRDAQKLGQQWPAGMAQAYTGRKQLRPQDIGILRKEGSESHYGKGFSHSILLDYILTISFEGIKLPSDFDTWKKSQKQ